MAQHRRYTKVERDRRAGIRPPKQYTVNTILNRLRKPRLGSVAAPFVYLPCEASHADVMDEGYDPLYTVAAGSNRAEFNLGDGCRRLMPRRYEA